MASRGHVSAPGPEGLPSRSRPLPGPGIPASQRDTTLCGLCSHSGTPTSGSSQLSSPQMRAPTRLEKQRPTEPLEPGLDPCCLAGLPMKLVSCRGPAHKPSPSQRCPRCPNPQPRPSAASRVVRPGAVPRQGSGSRVLCRGARPCWAGLLPISRELLCRSQLSWSTLQHLLTATCWAPRRAPPLQDERGGHRWAAVTPGRMLSWWPARLPSAECPGIPCPPRARRLEQAAAPGPALTSVCRFMCSRRVNFFPQISQG